MNEMCCLLPVLFLYRALMMNTKSVTTPLPPLSSRFLLLAEALLSVVKSLHLQGGCKCVCLVGGLVEDTQSSCVSAYACGSDCRGPFLRKLIKHPVTL